MVKNNNNNNDDDDDDDDFKMTVSQYYDKVYKSICHILLLGHFCFFATIF